MLQPLPFLFRKWLHQILNGSAPPGRVKRMLSPQRDSFPYPPGQLLTLPLKKGDEIPPQGFHRRGGNVSKRLKGSEVVVQRPKIALQGLLRPPGVPALDRCPAGIAKPPKSALPGSSANP